MEEDLAGTVIDDAYQLQSRIGRGAMGAIYKAEQLSLGKEVALKVLHRHLLKDSSLTRRFHREARAASRIDHPNCITVMDFGQSDTGLLYIAMEYIDGHDLADVIYNDYPFSYGRLLHIVKQVCMALDEAHALGVIHRDLKPENIMITQRRTDADFVKVLDFGIAKITDPKHKKNETFETVAGVVCGTPEYMSPEQARGQDLDARSDLYALGAIVYQMLTGKLPYEGESPMDVVTRHLTEPVPNPCLVVPNLPPSLVGLTQRLLDKDRDNRPGSAAEVLQEVQRIAVELGDDTSPVPAVLGAEDTERRQMLESSETDMYPSAAELALPLSLDVTVPLHLDTEPMAPFPTPRQMQRLETEAAESPFQPSRRSRERRTHLPSRTAWLSLTLTAIVAACIGGYVLLLSAQPTIGATGTAGEKIIVFEQLPDLPMPAAPAMAQLPMKPIPAPEAPSPAAEPKKQPPKETVTQAFATKPDLEPVPAPPPAAPVRARAKTKTRPKASQPAKRRTPAATAATTTSRKRASDNTKASMQTILKRARQAKATGRWADVITAYQEAYRTQSSARHLKEIGMAHVKQGQMRQGCRYFGRYIKKLSKSRRADAMERLAVFGCDLSL